MAIAIDSSSEGVIGGASSLTFSHTTSGSDRVLVVGVSVGAAMSVSTVTYNGVGMTQANTQNMGGAVFTNTYLYYLVAPATGANNVVISTSGAGFIWGYGLSFTGVDQTNPIAPTGGNTTLQAGGTTLTSTITTTVDNSRLCGIVQNSTGDGAFSSSDATLIAHAANWGASFYKATNSSPVGVHSVTITRALTGSYGINMVALAPVPSLSNSNFLMF